MVVETLTSGATVEESKRVLRFIERNPGISIRDICRRTGLRADVVKGNVDRLIAAGHITTRPGPKGSVLCYPALTEDGAA